MAGPGESRIQWVVGGLAAAFLTVSLTFGAALASMEQRLARVEGSSEILLTFGTTVTSVAQRLSSFETDRITHGEHEALQQSFYELKGGVAANSVQVQVNTRRLDILEEEMRRIIDGPFHLSRKPDSGP